MAADLYQSWFKIADEDKDGAIAGLEAVTFFQRSGLAQEILGQIWELAANGGPKLTLAQFGTSMKLVSLAQASGGRLPLDQARAIVAGVGPHVPPPRMAGLEQGPSAPPATPASTAHMPMHTSLPPRPAAPHSMDGFNRVSPTMIQSSSISATATADALTPATPQEIQRYQALFASLDQDKDGLVQGSECFGFFMSSGLEKSVLRDIWSLVAGDASALMQQQFVGSLYLMERAKRGLRLPTALPPGPFPPVASSQAAPLPTMPPLPARIGVPSEIPSSASSSFVSRLPRPDPALFSSLNTDERRRLEMEVMHAEDSEARLATAQASLAASRSAVEAYLSALSELALFRRSSEVALMTTQDAAARAGREVEEYKTKYETLYATLQSANERGQALVQQVSQLNATKAEIEAKAAALEVEISQIMSNTPQDVARLEAEIREVQRHIAAQEAAKEMAISKIDSVRRQLEAAKEKNAAAEKARADLDGEVEGLRTEVEELRGALGNVRTGGSAQLVQEMLTHCSGIYRSLIGHATRVGIQVPAEARLEAPDVIAWVEDVEEGTADWETEGGHDGFVAVDALPEIDARAPTPLAPAPNASSQPVSHGYTMQQQVQMPVYQYGMPAASTNSSSFAIDFSQGMGSTATSVYQVPQTNMFGYAGMAQPNAQAAMMYPQPVGFPTSF